MRARFDEDDVVQETCVRLLSEGLLCVGLLSEEEFRRRALGVMRNMVKRELSRKRDVRAEVGVPSRGRHPASGADPALSAEARDLVASLPTRTAQLVVSHHVSGYTIRELSLEFGLSVGKVHTLLRRARRP